VQVDGDRLEARERPPRHDDGLLIERGDRKQVVWEKGKGVGDERGCGRRGGGDLEAEAKIWWQGPDHSVVCGEARFSGRRKITKNEKTLT